MGSSTLSIIALCAISVHENLEAKLRNGEAVVVCPSLEDYALIQEKVCKKLLQAENKVKAVELSVIELPCCYALIGMVSEALRTFASKSSEKRIIPIYVKNVEPHLMERVEAELM